MVAQVGDAGGGNAVLNGEQIGPFLGDRCQPLAIGNGVRHRLIAIKDLFQGLGILLLVQPGDVDSQDLSQGRGIGQIDGLSSGCGVDKGEAQSDAGVVIGERSEDGHLHGHQFDGKCIGIAWIALKNLISIVAIEFDPSWQKQHRTDGLHRLIW